MKHRHLGPSGVAVPIIGQGTWQMENDDRSAAVRALRAGIDAGMTHIDTAELYGSGVVETIVAEATEGRRDEIYLVSKVLPSNASRKGTLSACDKSLARLRTDHLDCYLLHWPGSEPLAETIAAFEELVQKGKIRSWGVSNFDEAGLEQVLAASGPGKLTQNQVLYHLQERTIEHSVLPWCEANNVAVVGYTPFGRAAFPPRGESGRLLQTLAADHGVTPHAVALAFLTRSPALFAIPKSSNPDHVRANALAGDVSLSQTAVEALDKAFPRGPRRSSIPML